MSDESVARLLRQQLTRCGELIEAAQTSLDENAYRYPSASADVKDCRRLLGEVALSMNGAIGELCRGIEALLAMHGAMIERNAEFTEYQKRLLEHFDVSEETRH